MELYDETQNSQRDTIVSTSMLLGLLYLGLDTPVNVECTKG